MLTEEMLRDYLAQFMEHIEVDDEECARRRFVDVFQIGWNIEREYWEQAGHLPNHGRSATRGCGVRALDGAGGN